MAAPSPSGPHQAGQCLRPPEWSLSRSGLPKTNGPPCHPAMTEISTSAVASLISTRGANGELRHVRTHAEVCVPISKAKRAALDTAALMHPLYAGTRTGNGRGPNTIVR
jgi:hypothetical protein